MAISPHLQAPKEQAPKELPTRAASLRGQGSRGAKAGGHETFMGGRDPLALARSLSEKKYIPNCLIDDFLYIGGVRVGPFINKLGFDHFTHVVLTGCWVTVL